VLAAAAALALPRIASGSDIDAVNRD